MPRMKECLACGATDLFQYKSEIDATTIGGGLLPQLGSGLLQGAKLRARVCGSCGFLQLFATEEVGQALESSKHWEKV